MGLRKKESDDEPGVKKLPDWLKRCGFHENIKPKEILRIESSSYSFELDEESEVLNAEKIVNYAIKQSELLFEKLDKNAFQIILGGDCSVLLGTALALRKKGNFGLFFLDGHTDFIEPNLSQTKGAAGMDLAIATGHGHSKLTNILGYGNYLEEKNVFCVGNREYDSEYVEPILNSEITYYSLKESRKKGLVNIVADFLNMIEKSCLDGFFIHLDVDVLNDEIMPAVDSRADDGFSYSELGEILKPLFVSEKSFGIEITILDPNLDVEGRYTKEFVENFTRVIETSRNEQN